MKSPRSSGKPKKPNQASRASQSADELSSSPTDFSAASDPQSYGTQSSYSDTTSLRSASVDPNQLERENPGRFIRRITWPLLIRRVHGHSMVPVLPPSTLVIGLRWHRHPLPGEVVILTYQERELIKRIDYKRDGKLFVLGDHSETSTDSRHFGLVPEESVIARVIFPSNRKRAS